MSLYLVFITLEEKDKGRVNTGIPHKELRAAF